MPNRKLYENYYKDVRLQKRLISTNDFTYKNTLNVISKYIPTKGNVLDIGSGTGTVSFFFASMGLSVDGIEFSKNAVKYANLNKSFFSLNNVNYINTSIENYRTNKKYDLIICLEVLEHLVDDKDILMKISKLMNNRSILVISVPSINAPLYKLGLLHKFDKYVGHLRRYSIDEIKNLLVKLGFIIIDESKSEGIIRSILFTNKILSFIIKFTKFSLINNIISFLDKKTISIFGESQLILVCKKK